MIKKSEQKEVKPKPVGIFAKKALPISKNMQKDTDQKLISSDQTNTHKKCFQREIPIKPLKPFKKLPLDFGQT